MPRQARLDAPGALHHFTVKGYYSGSVVSALGGFNGRQRMDIEARVGKWMGGGLIMQEADEERDFWSKAD